VLRGGGSDIGVQDKRLDFIKPMRQLILVTLADLCSTLKEVMALTQQLLAERKVRFAIPIETAQRVANQLITTGRVEHPYRCATD